MMASCTEQELPNTSEEVLCESQNYNYSDVKAVIDASCIGCHAEGGEAESVGIFTSYEGLEAVLSTSSTNFISVIKSTNEETRMPPAANLPETDIQKIECWIAAALPEQ